MAKFQTTKIFRKLLLLILPLTIFASIATATLICWANYIYFRKTIRQDYSNIVATSASEIHSFVQNARRDLESLAWILRVTDIDARKVELCLTAFQYAKPKFAALRQVHAGAAEGTADWDKHDFQAEAVRTIEKAFSGISAVSSVVFSGTSLPMVYLAVPVVRSGKVGSVLFGSLNLESVWNVLEGIRIGSTGQVSILDSDGKLIGQNETGRMIASHPAESLKILHAIKAAAKPVEWMERKGGNSYYCIGAYVADQDWAVVLSQAAPEIYAYLYSDLTLAIVLSALICVIATFLGWWHVKRFTEPIQALHRQVLQIGAGDLERQVIITSIDEIGELGAAFNKMTVSLRKLIEREIRTAKNLAHAQNLAVLGIAAGKVTHEVGNLLCNLGIVAHVLKSEELSPRGREALVRMEKESTRLNAFIRSFLNFAKPRELRPVPTALDLVIREAISIHETAGAERGINFELCWPADAPKVNVDSRLMYQVFNNLIKNSFEAMPGAGRISFKGALDNGYIAIAVEDTGQGIALENREQIFEPFFSTKGDNGTGLGMAVVKSIITSHRGTITCHSEIAQGTRIIMRLPLM